MEIIKFTTDDEKQEIVLQKQALGLHMVAEYQIPEGKFVWFDQTPNPTQITIDQRLESIEDTQDLILLKLEGII